MSRASSRSERIGELWLEAQDALFGDSVSIEGYTPWWSYIPHFTGTPGYVYAYAYGYLFSLAIYRRYVQEGESMVEPVPRAAPRRGIAVAGGARARSSVSISPTRPSGRAGSTRSPRSSTRPSGSPPRSASARAG